MSQHYSDPSREEDDHAHASKIRLTAQNAELLAALRDIADAEYGTDTPKLRERARAAIAKADPRCPHCNSTLHTSAECTVRHSFAKAEGK
jgi:hypothetical protein